MAQKLFDNPVFIEVISQTPPICYQEGLNSLKKFKESQAYSILTKKQKDELIRLKQALSFQKNCLDKKTNNKFENNKIKNDKNKIVKKRKKTLSKEEDSGKKKLVKN
nr:11316_t:CDS:1 [Entrophospora candida]